MDLGFIYELSFNDRVDLGFIYKLSFNDRMDLGFIYELSFNDRVDLGFIYELSFNDRVDLGFIYELSFNDRVNNFSAVSRWHHYFLGTIEINHYSLLFQSDKTVAPFKLLVLEVFILPPDLNLKHQLHLILMVLKLEYV